MIDRLKEDILVVTFIKKDGSTRVMQCTLIPDFLPETKGNGSNPDITTVYDVENEGWRSFKNDSVISITDLNGNSLA